MAHKKGLGSSKNGRDSRSKRLGVKVFAGQTVTARVDEHLLGPKVKVFRYSPKKDSKKLKGHRSRLSKVTISDIAIS